jgi:hypothetical protein
VTLTKLKAAYEACHPGGRVPAATSDSWATAGPTTEEVLDALEVGRGGRDELQE